MCDKRVFMVDCNRVFIVDHNRVFMVDYNGVFIVDCNGVFIVVRGSHRYVCLVRVLAHDGDKVLTLPPALHKRGVCL